MSACFRRSKTFAIELDWRFSTDKYISYFQSAEAVSTDFVLFDNAKLR